MKYSRNTIINLVLITIILISFFLLPWISLLNYVSISAASGVFRISSLASDIDSLLPGFSSSNQVSLIILYFATNYAILIPIIVAYIALFSNKNQDRFDSVCFIGYIIDLVVCVICLLLRSMLISYVKDSFDFYDLQNYLGIAVNEILRLGFGWYVILFCAIGGLVVKFFLKDQPIGSSATIQRTNDNISKVYNSSKQMINSTASRFTGRTKEDTGNLLPVIVLNGRNQVNISKLPATIGRDRSQVDNYLFDNTISRQHAEIIVYNGDILLTDLGSVYGTYLNNEKVEKDDFYRVENHDRVKFGDLEFEIQINEVLFDSRYKNQPPKQSPVNNQAYSPQPNRQQSRTVPEIQSEPIRKNTNPRDDFATNERIDRNKTVKLTPDGGRNETFKLNYNGGEEAFPIMVLKEINNNNIVTVNKTPFIIGSEEGRVDEVINSRGVSKRHFTIERLNDLFYLTDLNSTNGTTLNGVLLSPNEKFNINPGDVIGVGQEQYRFEEI